LKEKYYHITSPISSKEKELPQKAATEVPAISEDKPVSLSESSSVAESIPKKPQSIFCKLIERLNEMIEE